MFWIGSSPALLVIILRYFVPESQSWVYQRKKSSMKSWPTKVKMVFKLHCTRIIHTILLMSCMHFISHGMKSIILNYLP